MGEGLLGKRRVIYQLLHWDIWPMMPLTLANLSLLV